MVRHNQFGKYIVNIAEGREIYVGDRILISQVCAFHQNFFK
ncbi:hypothetical protein [Komarekiella delphini-convector]